MQRKHYPTPEHVDDMIRAAKRQRTRVLRDGVVAIIRGFGPGKRR